MKFPEHDDASVLAETDIPYDRVVQVMDAVRAGHQVRHAHRRRPTTSPTSPIGDAPVSTAVAPT